MAGEVGYPVGEVLAVAQLSFNASAAGDHHGAVQLARQAEQITGGVPCSLARACGFVLTIVLIAAGDLAAAERVCVAALAWSRDAGDLWNQAGLLTRMVGLDLRAGRLEDAAAHLQEGLQIAARTGNWHELLHGLNQSAQLCAAAGRLTEAVTVWAADAALLGYQELTDAPGRNRFEPVGHAGQIADSARRVGASMTAASVCILPGSAWSAPKEPRRSPRRAAQAA